MIRIFTIGFTKKSAEEFFGRLRDAGVKRVIDIRLNNTSQLAGYTKKDDLQYFLRVICGIDYLHMLNLAPTKGLLTQYKIQKGDWAVYEKSFAELIRSRKIEEALDRELMNDACLLCSEAKPDRCHRRLVAEYLKEKWQDVEIVHLL